MCPASCYDYVIFSWCSKSTRTSVYVRSTSVNQSYSCSWCSASGKDFLRAKTVTNFSENQEGILMPKNLTWIFPTALSCLQSFSTLYKLLPRARMTLCWTKRRFSSHQERLYDKHRNLRGWRKKHMKIWTTQTEVGTCRELIVNGCCQYFRMSTTLCSGWIAASLGTCRALKTVQAISYGCGKDNCWLSLKEYHNVVR